MLAVDASLGLVPALGHALRRDQIPFGLANRFQSLAWEPIDRVGGYCWTTFAEWKGLVERLVSNAAPYVDQLPDGWRDEEAAELEKGLVNWRDRGFGSLVYAEQPVTSLMRQAAGLRRSLAQLGGHLVRSARAAASDLSTKAITVPTNKGKGAPLWIPGTDRKAAAALTVPYAMQLNLDETDDWLERYAQRGIGGCLTSYMRGQGGRSERTMMAPMGDRLVFAPKQVGMKVRRVDGFSFSKQLGAVRYHGLLRALMDIALPVTKGDWRPVAAELPKYRHAYATDISTFDDSVSWQLQEATIEEIHAPLAREFLDLGLISQFEHDYTLEYERWVITAPILAPSPVRGEVGRKVQRKGGVPSGSRGTSNNDTLYNMARHMACHEALGYRTTTYNFGDDTLVLSNDRLPDGYVEWNAQHGFTLKLAGAPIYLQRLLPAGHTLFSRMLVASVNKEARFEATSALHYATAIRIRHDLLEGHPLQDKFYSVLAASGTQPMLNGLNIAKVAPSTDWLMSRLADALQPGTPALEELAEWAQELQLTDAAPLLLEGQAQEELTRLSEIASSMQQSDVKKLLEAYGRRTP